MTTELTIEASGRAPGNVEANSGQRAGPFAPRHVATEPSSGRVDATTSVAVSGRSASRAYRCKWGSRYGWVDGIVTMGTIVGFAAALAAMAGEAFGTLASQMLQTIASTVVPAAPGMVGAGPAIEPRADRRPL
jgi:hypothetical protein